ncbi:MAG: hypothetical protein D6720_09485 [Gammaproteobacteria bacterium]|nr:MAG: hypothetical protein D6720_09485 [Gammaproteobacteria bacterium]
MLTALLLVGLFLTPIRNLDLWWHLDSGRWMLEHGQYLDREVRSFSMGGAPWPNFSWLFQVVVALVQRVAGDWGLWVFKGMVWWAIFYLLFRATGERGAPISWLLPVALFAWQLTPIMHLRPHLFEGFFIACALLLLQRPRNRATFWLSALLILLWANTHASVVVGATALGVNWLLGPRFDFPGWKTLARRLPGAVLLGALVFVTPNGLGILDVLFGHAQADYIAAYIREWEPSKLLPPFMFVTLAAVPLVLLLRRRLLTPGEFVLIAVFLLLASSNKRFLFELGLVLVRPAGVLIGQGLEKLGASHPQAAGRHGWRIGVLALVAVLLAYAPPWWWIEHRWQDYPVLRSQYPHVSLAVLRPLLDRERPLRVWNTYGWGGWLGWAGQGGLKIYIDGRTPTVFTEELMLHASLSKYRPRMLRSLLDAWKVDAVVLRRTPRPPLSPQDPQWRLVAYGDDELAYLRADLVKAHGVTVIPYDPYLPIERLDPARQAAAERALRQLLRRDPLNPLGWRHLAELLALRADAAAPAVIDQMGLALRHSLAQDPDQSLTRVRLAQWLRKTGAGQERIAEVLLPWVLEAGPTLLAGQEVSIALELMEIRYYDEALAVLKPKDPRRQQRLNADPEVWALRARIHARRGDLDRMRRARDMVGWLVLDAPAPAQQRYADLLETLKREQQVPESTD